MTGEVHPMSVSTADGVSLEAEWQAPSGGAGPRAVAVLTHPHPSYGGDMRNAVPDGLFRGLPAAGVAALRFNFRGTGGSSGTHGGGEPEVHDVVAALGAAAARAPGIPVLLVGYSFGADVGLAARHPALAGVVAVAPPLRVLPVSRLREPRGTSPTLVLSPEHDQFCPASEAVEVLARWPSTTVEAIPGADHLLAGRISWVVDRVVGFVASVT